MSMFQIILIIMRLVQQLLGVFILGKDCMTVDRTPLLQNKKYKSLILPTIYLYQLLTN